MGEDEPQIPPCPVCLNEEVGIDHEIFWTQEWVGSFMKSVMGCTYAGTPLDKRRIHGEDTT